MSQVVVTSVMGFLTLAEVCYWAKSGVVNVYVTSLHIGLLVFFLGRPWRIPSYVSVFLFCRPV